MAELSRYLRPAFLVAIAFALGCIAGQSATQRYVDPNQWEGQLETLLVSALLGALAATLTTFLVARQEAQWFTQLLRVPLRRK